MAAFSSEQWQEVSPYLDHALSLSEQERISWLVDFRSQHSDLADLIEQLLHEQRALSEERFLERCPPQPANGDAMAGETVGQYKLLSRIGEGGMGNVWLAERVDGRFERQVAIKFLRFAVASPESAERFRREGKILGQLAHPHIAELIDAGVTRKGEPYLVLEYVAGKQIDEYCDEHRLGVDSRIDLFLNVLAAVAHAHANLIVHRDIKPSNVLVTSVGDVKLLDFGIAKLLSGGSNSAVATLLTVEGAGALTPLFAAPEQVTGGAITIATDVYALGVLLYVLLTGQHPAGSTSRSPAELLKAITETDPRLASQAVASANDIASAENRAGTPDRLSRRLRGDLDTIIAKALKKRPEERYASATAFADDLRHYLAHEPIAARPDTFAYRFRKYVRRHRVGVAVATASVLVLSGFTVIQTVELRRITRERDRTSRLVQFTTNMFKISDPSESRGNSITAREILDKASTELGIGLAKDPETEAGMVNVMGNVYFGLGLYARAESLFRRALEIRRRVLGAENPGTLLAASDLGRALSVQGRYPQAESLFRETLAVEQRVLGPENPQTLTTMQRLANVLSAEDHIQDAEKLCRKTFEIRSRVLGLQHTDTLGSLDDLAWILLVQGRYAEAEKIQRDALQIEKQVQGEDHPDTLDSTNRLARIVSLEGRYGEAEQLQRQALDLERRVLGPEHLFTLRSMNNLADILGNERHYSEAETLYREIQAIDLRVLGPESPTTAATTYNLACLAALQGRRQQAFSLLRQSLEHGLSAQLAGRIEKDDDLKSIRSDPRFAPLLALAEQRAAVPQKAD